MSLHISDTYWSSESVTTDEHLEKEKKPMWFDEDISQIVSRLEIDVSGVRRSDF